MGHDRARSFILLTRHRFQEAILTSISSLSGSTTTYLSRYDTNGDGTVSASELAAANTTSSSSTTSVSLTSSSQEEVSTGDAAAAQLSSLMMSMILQAGGNEAQGKQSDDAASDQLSVSTLDTDGDGVVSAVEFNAAKPEDVSDDMSAQLFSVLDADGDGSITESEFSAARNGPPPPPPTDAADTSTTVDDTSAEDVLEQIQRTVEQYLASLAGGDEATDTLLTV